MHRTVAPERLPGALGLRFWWRTAQMAARRMDFTYPRWWDNQETVDEMMSHFTPFYRRMWEQLIRQRRGF